MLDFEYDQVVQPKKPQRPVPVLPSGIQTRDFQINQFVSRSRHSLSSLTKVHCKAVHAVMHTWSRFRHWGYLEET